MLMLPGTGTNWNWFFSFPSSAPTKKLCFPLHKREAMLKKQEEPFMGPGRSGTFECGCPKARSPQGHGERLPTYLYAINHNTDTRYR